MTTRRRSSDRGHGVSRDDSTLRAYPLTDQEARTIYKGLDVLIPLVIEAGRNTDEEVHALIALRERFYLGEGRA